MGEANTLPSGYQVSSPLCNLNCPGCYKQIANEESLVLQIIDENTEKNMTRRYLPAYLLDVRSIAGESPIAASNDKPSLFFIFSRCG